MPVTKVPFRSARPIASHAACSAGAGSNRNVHAASTIDNVARALNTALRPASAAAAPTTGPSIAPNVAAPIAVPSICPRRSRGVAASSHANAPAHVNPLPAPWKSRAAKRLQKPFANAKPTPASPIEVSPSSTARRGPNRVAAIPPANPATTNRN